MLFATKCIEPQPYFYHLKRFILCIFVLNYRATERELVTFLCDYCGKKEHKMVTFERGTVSLFPL